MITSEGYPTYCSGGKGIYPSRNLIREADMINDGEYDYNDGEVYGSKTSKYERFRDLGIPMFVLHMNSSQHDGEYNNQDDADVISEEMFDNLYKMVAKMSRNKDTRRNKKACKTVAPKQTRRQYKSSKESNKE